MNKESSHIEWTREMLFDRLVELVDLSKISRDPESARAQDLARERALIDFEIAQRTGAVVLEAAGGKRP
jgi:hypothetical protein